MIDRINSYLQNKYIIATCFMFVVIVMSVFNNNLPIEPKNDGLLYNSIAIAISADSSKIITPTLYFGEDIIGHDLEEFVMPGYSFIVGMLYKVFGVNYNVVFVFQSLLFIIGGILFFYLMKSFINPVPALLAALWYITYTPLIFYNSKLFIESLTVSILVFALFCLKKYFNSYKYHWLAGFSILFAVLITVNNRFIVLLGFLVFALLFFIQLNFRKRIIHLLIPILATIVLLLPWHIRLFMKYDHFVPFGYHYYKMIKRSLPGSPNKESLRFRPWKGAVDSFAKNGLTKEKYEKMQEDYIKQGDWKGKKKYLSRLGGFFSFYNLQFRFGRGGDTRISKPNITKKKYYILIFYGMIVSLLFLSFLGLHWYDKPFLSKGILLLLLLSLIPLLFNSTKLNVMLMHFAGIFGVFFAIKNKNYFVLSIQF